jgi:hypothetical protein
MPERCMVSHFNFTEGFSRKVLVGLWFAFFFTDISVLLWLYSANWIEKDNFRSALTQVNSVYVTYLGAIVGFYLSKRSVGRHDRKLEMPFIVAFCCSVFWNFIVSFFILRLVFLSGTVEDSIKQIGEVGPLLSWLVAPVLGFYFASGMEKQASRETSSE